MVIGYVRLTDLTVTIRYNTEVAKKIGGLVLSGAERTAQGKDS